MLTQFYFFSFTLVFLIGTFSKIVQAEKTQRHHKAHVHGEAQIHVAFDGLKGRVEFKSPAEAILGFEHSAESDRDKKKLEDTRLSFEKKMSSWIQLDPSKNCNWTPKKIHQEVDAKGHSDFEASFDVECSSSPEGTRAQVDFSEFKRIKKIELTLLTDSVQKTVKKRSNKFEFDFKH